MQLFHLHTRRADDIGRWHAREACETVPQCRAPVAVLQDVAVANLGPDQVCLQRARQSLEHPAHSLVHFFQAVKDPSHGRSEPDVKKRTS